MSRALGRRPSRMRLSTAVGLAVLTGVAIAAVTEWVLFIALHPKAGGTSVDVTKLALTVVGGVGGVVALVVAYRRQRDVEQGRFVERFGAAAAQLGATDVAVRMAGVYAMAGVADESDGLRRQQCIDVLCGYLRLPYDADHGSSGRTKLVVTTPTPRVADDLEPGKVEEHREFRQNDREVRKTIVRVIADHLRETTENNWSDSNFDFRATHLEDARFRNATFAGAVSFEEATFIGDAQFDDATFAGDTHFGRVTFTDTAEFKGATFADIAWFEGATFTGDVLFVDTTFADVACFAGATFTRDALFEDATFTRDALFGDAMFTAGGWFVRATFSGNAEFRHATSTNNAWFELATFTGGACFTGATFRSDVRFGNATFTGPANFEFGGATFVADVDFEGVTFGAHCDFRGVNFGTGLVSFSRPKEWGPPAPWFDWDADPSDKPVNVRPEAWPPSLWWEASKPDVSRAG